MCIKRLKKESHYTHKTSKRKKITCLAFYHLYAFYAFYACEITSNNLIYAFYAFYACEITPNNLIYYTALFMLVKVFFLFFFLDIFKRIKILPFFISVCLYGLHAFRVCEIFSIKKKSYITLITSSILSPEIRF